MAKSSSFRVALFGGYNKEDVQEYISTLENEIESIKVLHQREKNELMRKMESDREEQLEEEKQVPKLNEELQQSEDKVRILMQQLEEKEKEQEQLSRTLAAKAEQEAHSKEEREKMQQELEQYRQKLERQKSEVQPGEDTLSEEKEESLRRYSVLEKENENLKREKAEAEKKMADMLAEKEKGVIDYQAISKVLEDARQNARIIEEEAQKHSEEIIESANRKAQKQKEIMIKKITMELDDKGIQLIAAKHKIDQYAKEIKRAQEGLYNIYSSMKHMASSMPVRVDDFWKGDPYRELENQDDTTPGADAALLHSGSGSA